MPSKFQEANPTVDLVVDGNHYVFDQDTGEIYEWPEGESRKMERLLSMAMTIEAQAKTWTEALGAWKALIRRQMEAAGVERVAGGAGGATILDTSQPYHVKGGPELAQWLRDVEFPPAQWLSLVLCVQANGVNPSALRFLCEELGLDRMEDGPDGPVMVRESDKIIDFRPGKWVRLDHPKQRAEISRSPAR